MECMINCPECGKIIVQVDGQYKCIHCDYESLGNIFENLFNTNQ